MENSLFESFINKLENKWKVLLKTVEDYDYLNVYGFRNIEITEIEEKINQILKDYSLLFNEEISSIKGNSEYYSLIRKKSGISYFDDIIIGISDSIEMEISNLELYNFQFFSFEDLDKNLNRFIEIIARINNLLTSIKNIPLFVDLLKEEQSVFIIGENGSGKSTLLNDVKNNRLQKMYVIPASKNLEMFDDNNDKYDSIENVLVKETLKKGNNQYKNIDERFSNILHFLKREHHFSKSDNSEIKISKLDKVNNVFNDLFSELTIKVDSFKSKLYVERNLSDKIYHYPINMLSDGERSALMYISFVLLGGDKSIFVIDEPETHLNLSICIRLWKMLLSEKNNCKFIFISHNPYFVSAMESSRIVWCKEYNNINDYKLEDIEDGIIPNELLIQLLGSKKKVLLCEGDYSSLDYRVYDALYSKYYYVKPVGGHEQVKSYVRAMKEFNDLNSNVIGIIDRDFIEESDIEKFVDEGIYVLPVNEIEMLIIIEEALERLLDFDFDRGNERSQNFINGFIEKNKEMVDKQVLDYLRYYYSNNIIEYDGGRVEKFKSYLDYKIKEFSDFEKLFEKRKEKLSSYLENVNYSEILKYSTIKKAIFEILNKMDNNYEARLISEIKRDVNFAKIFTNRIGIPLN